MKKVLLASLLLCTLLFISCGEDEESEPEVGLSGTITFDGQTYAIASGALSQTTTSSSTEIEFFLADGTVTSSGSSSDSQIIIGIRAISEGTESLESGTYETNRDVTSKYAYVSVSTADVSNLQSVVGGTIDISGSGNTYSLTFNGVPFGQGIELSGSVSGTYEN